MIPIGTTVRWRPAIDKRAAVIGVATARRPERTGDQIEIDHRDWWVSEALLEVVGEMTSIDLPQVIVERDALRVEKNAMWAALESTREERDRIEDWHAAAVAERDALRELVVAQATKNAELAQELAETREALKDAEEERDAADEVNAENLSGVREDLKRDEAETAHRVEDLLLLFMGERRPVRPIEPPELRRLAEFAFEGV